MPFLLSERRVDLLITHFRRYLLAGLAGLLVTLSLDAPGMITAFMATWLGASAGSLQPWRRERGLYQLSTLFFLLSLVLYSLFQYGSLIDLLHQRRNPPLIAIDAGASLYLLSLQTRLLATITLLNRRLSHQNPDS